MRAKEAIDSFCPPLLFSVFVLFVCFSLSSIIFISLTLIIGIFYCLIYTLLLLHLITTHFVSHLSLSSIVFIISMLIIGIFYCLNYTLLLLHLLMIHVSLYNPCNGFCNNYVINIWSEQI